MDYSKILLPIVERLGKEADVVWDEGRWTATSQVYVGDVLFYAAWNDRGRAELLDCLHDVPGDRKSLSNVFDWVQANLWNASDIEDYHEQPEEYDKYDEHGFRDAADYYNWRYGRSIR